MKAMSPGTSKSALMATRSPLRRTVADEESIAF
jgi:hypothetical protein